VHYGVGEIVEGAFAAMAPVAFAPGSIVVGAPGTHVVAVTPGTLERTLVPPQRMDVGLAVFSTEKVMEM
jgi:hypothetical protein